LASADETSVDAVSAASADQGVSTAAVEQKKARRFNMPIPFASGRKPSSDAIACIRSRNTHFQNQAVSSSIAASDNLSGRFVSKSH
jgi:hypothetical protein